MAEGGKQQRSFKDSLCKASDDADESFCDPCSNECKWIAVEGYCHTCDEYLCETCLGVHRKQKITRAHAIMDTKQMHRRQRSLRNPDLCFELCKTHHPEIIRFYCEDHDEPGCGDCMTLNHTSCKKVRVQDISDGFQETKEFKNIDRKLQSLYEELEEMEDVLDQDLKILDTTYYNVLRNIASVRRQMNEYLDQIQTKIKDEAAQMKKEDEKELKTVRAKNLAMKAEIEIMLETMNDSNVNVSSIFISTKQAKQRMVSIEKEINIIMQKRQHQYVFQIFNELEKIVSAKPQLGKLSRKYTQNEQREPMAPRTPSIDVTATYNRSINVKSEADKDTCWISDSSLLSPDRLLVIDSVNKNVKLIDISNNKVVSCFRTSSEPRGVTTLSTHMIAVTLSTERKIQLLNAIPTITLERKMIVKNDCCGIAYKDRKFAVSYMYPGRVEILDIQGKILHSIQPKQGTEYILQRPEYITFGQKNDTVIVSDCRTHNVSVFTFKGQIRRTYIHEKLNDPTGVVVTADGVLFVCSCESKCIHVVSPNFMRSKIIIEGKDNMVHPSSITYCDINKRLYISNISAFGDIINNQIQVYDLEVSI